MSRANVTSLATAFGWSLHCKQSAPLQVQENRVWWRLCIGTIVAAVRTQAAVAGHLLPQVVLPDHTDLPSAAALQVEDPLRLNHAHSSVVCGS